MSQKLTLFICLVGVALVASLAAEAQKAPAPPADKPGSQPPRPPTPPQPEVANGDEEEEQEEEEEDYMAEDMGGEEDYEECDDEYEYEGEEEPESSEERLSELLEEHFAVKRDCQDLKSMVAEAKQSNQTADPDMQPAYEGCMKELHEIEFQMKALIQDIFSSGESQS